MFFLSCVCYAFLRVCLYVPCGYLLGKDSPLGSPLIVVSNCHFPIGIMGQVGYLIVSIPDLCNLTYFYIGEAIGPPFEKVEFPPANFSPPPPPGKCLTAHLHGISENYSLKEAIIGLTLQTKLRTK